MAAERTDPGTDPEHECAAVLAMGGSGRAVVLCWKSVATHPVSGVRGGGSTSWVVAHGLLVESPGRGSTPEDPMLTTVSRALPRALLAAALITLVSTSPAKAILVLLDDMSAPSYSGFSFNSADYGSNPSDESSASFDSVSAGGNPDEYLQVDHTHQLARDDDGNPLDGDGSTQLQSFTNDESVEYNPSLQGAIASIAFSLDILLTDAPGGADFSMIFFNVQDSGGGNSAGFTTISPAPGWQTITVTGLTNANYSGRDFAGALDLNFGFGFESFGDVTDGDEAISVGIDNFRVDVTVVPEPGAALLVGLGAMLLSARRGARSGFVAR